MLGLGVLLLSGVGMAGRTRTQPFTAASGSTRTLATYMTLAGDLDGDGYQELLVSEQVTLNVRSMHLFYGGPGGYDFSTHETWTPELPDAWGSSAERLGEVSPLGDINGDGYDDFALGFPYYDESGEVSASGALQLYYGSAAGVDVDNPDLVRLADPQRGGWLGAVILGAGDLNGDGYDDIVCSHSGNTTNLVVFPGSGTGPVTGDEELLNYDSGTSSQFGAQMAAVGDVDGDGLDDVVAADAYYSYGSIQSGAVLLLSGDVDDGLRESADVIYPTDFTNSQRFGTGIAAGDMTGDGKSDLLVITERFQSSSNGGLYLYEAGSGTLNEVSGEAASDLGPISDLYSTVSIGGDLDGDGTQDALITARGSSWGSSLALVYGDTTGVVPYVEVVTGTSSDYGNAHISLGDLDGDGWGEMLVADDKHNYLLHYTGACVDQDGDGDCYQDDCDDNDSTVGPSARDTCGDGVDSDCDGIGGPDGDEDGDGLSYTEERSIGTKDCNSDSDHDGLSDLEESTVTGTDPTRADPDNDGLEDPDELAAGTDPYDKDTDDDGLSDGDEIALGTDPLRADADGDGLNDAEEVAAGSDPFNPDTDGDGLRDDEEVNLGTNPALSDTDEDGLSDSQELTVHTTDPLDPDTDNGGVLDGDEVNVDRTDPLERTDDLSDWDEDGLAQWEEEQLGTDPYDPDTDSDGMLDGEDPEPLVHQSQGGALVDPTIEPVYAWEGCSHLADGTKLPAWWLLAMPLLWCRRRP